MSDARPWKRSVWIFGRCCRVEPTGGTARRPRPTRQGIAHLNPYKYVSVEGPIIAIETADLKRDLRPLAHRYLGVEGGDAYVATTREEHVDNVLVRMRPERWLTVDFAKMGGSP